MWSCIQSIPRTGASGEGLRVVIQLANWAPNVIERESARERFCAANPLADARGSVATDQAWRARRAAYTCVATPTLSQHCQGIGMSHYIGEPCIGTKDSACVDVCPVDCIHPRPDEQD